jgi:hypothetical protein
MRFASVGMTRVRELALELLLEGGTCCFSTAFHYLAVQPPSITMSVPVTNPANSEQR